MNVIELSRRNHCTQLILFIPCLFSSPLSTAGQEAKISIRRPEVRPAQRRPQQLLRIHPFPRRTSTPPPWVRQGPSLIRSQVSAGREHRLGWRKKDFKVKWFFPILPDFSLSFNTTSTSLIALLMYLTTGDRPTVFRDRTPSPLLPSTKKWSGLFRPSGSEFSKYENSIRYSLPSHHKMAPGGWCGTFITNARFVSNFPHPFFRNSTRMIPAEARKNCSTIRCCRLSFSFFHPNVSWVHNGRPNRHVPSSS